MDLSLKPYTTMDMDMDVDLSLKPCTTMDISLLVNRLTTLPDELLIRILSLLPTTKDAATCVLSKKLFRRLFPWVTSLNFDVSPIFLCLKHPFEIKRFATFVTFVDNVLLAYQSPYLTRFRLRVGSVNFGTRYFFGCTNRECREGCLPDLKPTQINAWISFPLTRYGLRELDLCILVREPGDGQLPPEIFTCETLEVLKLDVNLGLDRVFTMPSYHLPNLKLLYLCASLITEDGFLPRLVYSCPLLEDLTFEAWWNNVHYTAIDSPSLRRLCLRIHKLDTLSNTDIVVIHTPNLEYFEYFDNLALHYSIPIMHCLVKADLEIPFILEYEKLEVSFQQILSLIRPLSYVQHLSLIGCFMEDLDCVEVKDQLPVFPNLNHLELGCSTYNFYWDKLLLAFLNCSPVLETLVFSEGLTRYYDARDMDRFFDRGPLELEREFFRTAHAIPSCCRHHLKRIVINSYFGLEREVELIQFLLRHALVLEELVICRSQKPWYPIVDQMSVESKLMNLPRASVTCSIQVL